MFYGILPIALEGGFVAVNSKTARYSRPHIKDDKQIYQKEIYTSDFWLTIFRDTDFKSFIEDQFKLSGKMDDNSGVIDQIGSMGGTKINDDTNQPAVVSVGESQIVSD